MTQNFSKNNFINYALSKGYSAKDINTALQDAGMGGYNPLTYSGNWANLGANAAKDVKEIGRGLTTVAGSLANSFREGIQGGNIQEKFLSAINSEPARRTVQGALAGAAAGRMIPKVGLVGGALLGGTSALLGGKRGIVAGGKDLVDAVLSTYNTSIDDIAKGNFDWRNALQGAMEHPVYSSTDLLPFAYKGIGKAGKAINAKTGMAQKLIPGLKQAELNRALTNYKLWSSQNTADVYKGLNALAKTPLAKREKIVESIVRGSAKDLSVDEQLIANQLKTDLRSASDILSDMGIFNKDFSRDNTIAQYAMSELLDTDLLHQDIMDIISGRKLRPSASNMFRNPNLSKRVLSAIDKGEKLYDENKIAFLSQKLANSYDPTGEVIARHVNLQEGTPSNYARIIGRATKEQQGNVLDATIKSQLDASTRAKQAVEVFSNVVNDDMLGIKLSPEDKVKYINAFRDSLKRDVSQDRMPNFLDALNNSGIDTELIRQGNPVAYESLKGFFATPRASFMEDFNKVFKKNVLGTPAWTVGNRLGNWSLNAIEGVEAIDYLDAQRYKKLIPDAFKLQTSYNSYLDVGNEAMTKGLKSKSGSRAFAKAATEFKKSYGKFKNSDKTAADIGRYIADTIGDISNATASPIFELEANMEFLDRSANYIHQAKEYAKANKMKLKDVLTKAKTDRKLFSELNTRVNKSLGDYYGRNYALPSQLQSATNLFFPFYRFPVQTLRTTAHAIANHPGRFASNVTIPARGGNVLSDAIMNYYGLDPDTYEGGVPYKLDDGSVRTLGMIPTPIGMVAPRFLDVGKFSSMVNPLLSGEMLNAIKYQKDFGDGKIKVPTSPRYTAMKMTNPIEAMNYKPTVGERASLIANEILGSTSNPYILGTRVIPQAVDTVLGRGRQPFYDTMQPIRYKVNKDGKRVFEFEREFNNIKGPIRYTLQNPEGYMKTLPVELLGGQVGISTRPNYPKKGAKKSDIKKAANVRKYAAKNIEKNR